MPDGTVLPGFNIALGGTYGITPLPSMQLNDAFLHYNLHEDRASGNHQGATRLHLHAGQGGHKAGSLVRLGPQAQVFRSMDVV